jgi:Holliday junction resolvase-like predicted endonuclease
MMLLSLATYGGIFLVSGITSETVASEALFEYFKAAPCSSVLSWHPPDGKAYFTRLLYLPIDGKRSHIDLIIQIKKTLIFIEVKDCLSNSYEDVEKLKRITAVFSLEKIIKQFSRQGITFNEFPERIEFAIAAKMSDIGFIDKNNEIAILLADASGVKHGNDSGLTLLNLSQGFS